MGHDVDEPVTTRRLFLHTYPTASDTVRGVANRLVTHARRSIASGGFFSLALAGGSTPRALYTLLAREFQKSIEWPKVHVWWSDERCVPHDHADSNTRMAHESLLANVPIPQPNIHLIRTELGPERAAADYEARLRAFDPVSPVDVTLLGMGTDGHTASLFPGGIPVDEKRRWVLPAEAPPKSPIKERITFTIPLIAASQAVVFLVVGAEKRVLIQDVLGDPFGDLGTRSPLPVQRLGAAAMVEWFLDAAAAGSVRP